jgi:protease-4
MNFWKLLLGTILGSLIAGVVLFFLAFMFIAGLAASAGERKIVEVADNSVLTVNLDRPITERAGDDPFENLAALSGNVESGLGLNTILAGIHHAKTDDKIRGIYLKTGFFGGGTGSLEAVRNALEDFKKSGKFVYAYAEFYTESAYYLATTADSIFLYPTGVMEWNGLGSTPMFIKGTFDKLGIEPILFRGPGNKFKSYGEMYMRKNMSEENKEQIRELLNDLWLHMLEKMAASRKTDVAKLQNLANTLAVGGAQSALKAGLVDGLRYEDEVEDLIKAKMGLDKKKKLKLVSLEKYDDSFVPNSGKNNKIAVIYAVGDIQSGSGNNETIGSKTMVEALRKARLDDNVKAIVLRINSPGGSALASDVILREVVLAKKAKPVIASYGDLAASGGYYISAVCDKIVAEPTTITGSIGIFGVLFNTEKLFDDKLGITFDRVTTNPYADLANPNRRMTPVEAQFIQTQIDTGYYGFLDIVKSGRGFASREAVNNIAQGRVWSGKRAKEIKLVDELGGLDVALKMAAEKAGVGDDYSVVDYPRYKTGIEQLMEVLGKDAKYRFAKMFFTKEELQVLEMRKKLEGRFNAENGIYMRMPEEYTIR